MIPHCSIFAATAKSNIIVQKKRQHCPELYLLYVVFRVRVILLFAEEEDTGLNSNLPRGIILDPQPIVSEWLTFSFLFYDCAKIIFRYWSLAVWDSAAPLYVDMRFIRVRPHLSADQDSAVAKQAWSRMAGTAQNQVFYV